MQNNKYNNSSNNRYLYIFLVIFFLSGATSLMYEILWMRFFSLCLGSTIYSVSAITFAYMGGLAIGAYIIGKYSDLTSKPLIYYGLFELIIGIYALIFHYNLSNIEALSLLFNNIFSKFLFVTLIIIIPVMLMGATLPFITSSYVRKFQPADSEFIASLFYGINSLGAVFGILITSFYLLLKFGNTVTTLITVFLNFVIAIASFYLSYNLNLNNLPSMSTKQLENENISFSKFSYIFYFVALSFFIVGFCSLALEVILTRLLILVIGPSTYAFPLILMSYILGITIGTVILPILIKRKPKFTTLGIVLLLLSIVSLITISLLSDIPFVFLKMYEKLYGNFLKLMLFEYFLCFLVLILPATLSGYAFFCSLNALKTSKMQIGSKISILYFLNTLGSVLGSVAAPFLFIKYLGLQNSIITISLVYFLTGTLVILFSNLNFKLKIFRMGIPAICLICWLLFASGLDMDVLSYGIHYYPEKFINKNVKQIIEKIKKEKKIYFACGIDSIVGVYAKSEVLSLKINGKTDASTSWYDMNTQLLLGHLPMLLARYNQNVAVIGLGAGITLGAVLKYNPKLVDCIEINQNVVEAAKYFTFVSELDFNSKNLRLIVDDALSYIKTTKEKYDVIISEPSNPWMSGVASLFTYDHFLKCYEKLSEYGLMCQWLQLYSMSIEDFMRIILTFKKVFPNTELWLSSWGDALLIGTKKEYDFDFNVIKKRLDENESIKKQLRLIEIFSVESILAHQLLDRVSLDKLMQNYNYLQINTHNHPILEFTAPISYYNQSYHKITKILLNAQDFDKLYLKTFLELYYEINEITYENIARVYFKLKMHDMAKEYFKKATNKNPSLWYIHLIKAEKYYNEKLFFEALNEIQVALFLAPEKYESYIALFKIALELEDYYSIVRVFSEADKYFNGFDRYQYYLALGVGYDGLDEYQYAIDNYKKAIDIYPKCFLANKKLGLLYYKLNDYIQADYYLSNAYFLNPNDKEILDTLLKLRNKGVDKL